MNIYIDKYSQEIFKLNCPLENCQFTYCKRNKGGLKKAQVHVVL